MVDLKGKRGGGTGKGKVLGTRGDTELLWNNLWELCEGGGRWIKKEVQVGAHYWGGGGGCLREKKDTEDLQHVDLRNHYTSGKEKSERKAVWKYWQILCNWLHLGRGKVELAKWRAFRRCWPEIGNVHSKKGSGLYLCTKIINPLATEGKHLLKIITNQTVCNCISLQFNFIDKTAHKTIIK